MEIKEATLCGVRFAQYSCTLHAGHGRIRANNHTKTHWYDHADPAKNTWWNVVVTAPCQPIGCDNGHHVPGCELAKVDADLPSDVSIPRQDGQPFGDRYVTYHHEGGLVGVVAPREGVVDLDAGMMYSYPVPPESQPESQPVVDTEVETWYGVFNDPATLLPKFESGEIHAGLRETLLDTPIFESLNLGDVLRHAQLTWEDRKVQHRDKVRVAEAQLLAPTRVVDGKLVRITPEVPPPTPVVIKTQMVTRTGWAIVPPDVLKNAVGGPAIREVSM